MIKGIVDVFGKNGSKSEISYDVDKPDTLQSILDYTKTTKDLGYTPEYDYISLLNDFKEEMETEPFSELWGKRSDYEKMYGDKV